MSYSEDSNGDVLLRMTQDDYERVLMIFGMAAGAALQGKGMLNLDVILTTLNRINEGNPRYLPYRVERIRQR